MALSVTSQNPGTISSVGDASSGALAPVSGGGTPYNFTPDTSGGGTAGTFSPAQAPADPNLTLPNSNGSGGTGTGSGAAAAAKVAGFRSTIQNLSKSIMDVYDQLYGAVGHAGADQANLVDQKYNTQSKALSDQYQQDQGLVGASYSGRGAYDSSYRANAEDNTTNAFNNQQDIQGQGRQSDLGKVGQFVGEQQAGINANKEGVQAVLDRINNTEDPNELLTLQNTIQAKLQAAGAQKASLGDQGGYASQAQALTDATPQVAALQAQLHSIIQGNAASPLKASVASKIIAASGLAPDKQQALLQDVTQQIAAQNQIQPQG